MAYTTIDKPSDYFNTKLYTGNGGTQSITGVGFQPDFTWIKGRSYVDDHALFDTIRGVTKILYSNEVNAEETYANSLTAFDSDGFSIGSMAEVNTNSATLVSWNWKANGSGSLNEVGSIDSTVSANTTSGFSIVKFVGNETAGATVGHGLGSVPSMIIVKKISTGTQNWRVYHKGTDTSAPQDYDLKLNLTNARDNDNTVWNDTAPTSSLFSLGTGASVNASGATMIAYCFADVQGFSKFGSYTGNGNADGTFVYTGFKPAFVIIKIASGTGNWNIFDIKRDGYNGENENLSANLSDAESAGNNRIDILSNGFKVRASTADVGSSGATYIYIAFAENPFVSSTGVPATAR